MNIKTIEDLKALPKSEKFDLLELIIQKFGGDTYSSGFIEVLNLDDILDFEAINGSTKVHTYNKVAREMTEEQIKKEFKEEHLVKYTECRISSLYGQGNVIPHAAEVFYKDKEGNIDIKKIYGIVVDTIREDERHSGEVKNTLISRSLEGLSSELEKMSEKEVLDTIDMLEDFKAIPEDPMSFSFRLPLFSNVNVAKETKLSLLERLYPNLPNRSQVEQIAAHFSEKFRITESAENQPRKYVEAMEVMMEFFVMKNTRIRSKQPAAQSLFDRLMIGNFISDWSSRFSDILADSLIGTNPEVKLKQALKDSKLSDFIIAYNIDASDRIFEGLLSDKISPRSAADFALRFIAIVRGYDTSIKIFRRMISYNTRYSVRSFMGQEPILGLSYMETVEVKRALSNQSEIRTPFELKSMIDHIIKSGKIPVEDLVIGDTKSGLLTIGSPEHNYFSLAQSYDYSNSENMPENLKMKKFNIYNKKGTKELNFHEVLLEEVIRSYYANRSDIKDIQTFIHNSLRDTESLSASSSYGKMDPARDMNSRIKSAIKSSMDGHSKVVLVNYMDNLKMLMFGYGVLETITGEKLELPESILDRNLVNPNIFFPNFENKIFANIGHGERYWAAMGAGLDIKPSYNVLGQLVAKSIDFSKSDGNADFKEFLEEYVETMDDAIQKSKERRRNPWGRSNPLSAVEQFITSGPDWELTEFFEALFEELKENSLNPHVLSGIEEYEDLTMSTIYSSSLILKTV